MTEIACGKPCLCRADGLGRQSATDRTDGLFQRETVSENGPCRHIGDDRQIRTADEHTVPVDNLHEIDVGRGMVDWQTSSGCGAWM